MIKTSLFWKLICIVILSACYASSDSSNQQSQQDLSVIEKLNSKKLWPLEAVILCQVLGLLYHLPQLRREFMEVVENSMKLEKFVPFIVARALFYLEIGQFDNDKFEGLVDFFDLAEIPYSDLNLLFWNFLMKVGKYLEKLEDINVGSIELACFSGTKQVERVNVDSLGTLGDELKARSGFEYVIVFFKDKSGAIQISDFSDYDLIMAVQEVYIQRQPGSRYLAKTLIGLPGSSFKQDPQNARALLLRKKSVNEEPLGKLPEELYKKFEYVASNSTFQPRNPTRAPEPSVTPNSFVPISYEPLPRTQAQEPYPPSQGSSSKAVQELPLQQQPSVAESSTKMPELNRSGRKFRFALGCSVAVVAALFCTWYLSG